MPASIELGLECLKAGNVDEAIQHLEEATVQLPDDYRSFSYLGAAYARKGLRDKAVGAFLAALQKRPDIPSIHYNLGLVYRADGSLDKAKSEFEKALKLDPKYVRAEEALRPLCTDADVPVEESCSSPGQQVGGPTSAVDQSAERSADEVIEALFTKAIPSIRPQSEAQIREHYAGLSGAWGSKDLFAGSEAEIRALVLKNLRRLAESPSFESFRVKTYDSYSVQVEALFPKAFIGVRIWRTEERLFACGNRLFGESPGTPDLDRVGRSPETKDLTGKIRITVSDDPFGRAVKMIFEHLRRNYEKKPFSREVLPPVTHEFEAEVGRIMAGDRRNGDPTPVVENEGDSIHQVAKNMVLWELSRALLIEATGETGAAIDPKGGPTTWWPGEPFVLTKKGKKSVVVVA